MKDLIRRKLRIRSFFKLGGNWIVATKTRKLQRNTFLMPINQKKPFSPIGEKGFSNYAKSSSGEMYGSPCASATA